MITFHTQLSAGRESGAVKAARGAGPRTRSTAASSEQEIAQHVDGVRQQGLAIAPDHIPER